VACVAGLATRCQARPDPRFIKVSADLKAYIEAYDEATGRSSAYHWEQNR
jgi:hypothetical protein